MSNTYTRVPRGTISSLASSKGGIIQNSDGTYYYRTESSPFIRVVNPNLEDKLVDRCSIQSCQTNENQQIILPIFGEEEMAFYVSVTSNSKKRLALRTSRLGPRNPRNLRGARHHVPDHPLLPDDHRNPLHLRMLR